MFPRHAARASVLEAHKGRGRREYARGQQKSRGRRYCRPRLLCCRLAALHHQKPSENGRSIPIFDGKPRNTAYALGSEACGDHILQRHTCSHNDHCVPIECGWTFFYQNIKNPARVSRPHATTFEGILACPSTGSGEPAAWYLPFVYCFSPGGAKNNTRDDKFVLSVNPCRFFARQG